jgi:RNA recognition motif-containing protein
MNIYVGNLSRQASENDVRALFASFGEVKSVKIIKDNETGELRGFAFVEMMDGGSEAINALNAKEFMNRRINVNEAKPRAPKTYNSFSSPFGYKNRFEKY